MDFLSGMLFYIPPFGETKKLEAAAVNMEGEALNWFQWVDVHWLELNNLLLELFELTQEGSKCEKFLAIQ